MPPAGATIFKLEQTFLRVNVDYAELNEMLRKGDRPTAGTPTQPTVFSRILSLKMQLGRKAYEEVRLRAESAAERLESRALAEAQMLPGIVPSLEAIRDMGWWIVVASNLSKRVVTEFLQLKALSQHVNMVVARSRLDEVGSAERLLRPVKSRLKTLANSVYFCNSSREVAEAKSLGMKCFVLPNPVEPFRMLYQAGPTGIILSLEEIPQLLSLPAMKLPQQAPGPARKESGVLGAEPAESS